MNDWLPQASYPYGNFSDTSSFKFRRTKGSIGQTFTVRIRIGNHNQTSFYPFVAHEISVLVELILGHLRYLLTNVPPQPNSPPDNVFRPDRPIEANLGSKKRGNASPPIHGISKITLKVVRVIVTPAVYLRLVEFLHFDIQSTGRNHIAGPEGPVPNPSPDRHVTTCSRRGSSSSSPPTGDGFGIGTPVPSPQSQSFSQGCGSILPTSLAYIVPSTRGYSPWRPDAVMSMTGRGRHSVLRIYKGRRGRTGHHATCGALLAAGPYLQLSRFQGGQAICTDDRSARAHALGFTATAAPSYSSGLGPCPDGRVSAQLGTVTQLPVHPASPVLLTKNGPLGALDSMARLNRAVVPSYLFKTVRLVFRPYTQVRRTICTSVSLRASPRVSSSFALLRHSSPSFGSRQPGLGPPLQFASVNVPSRSADQLTLFHIRLGHIAGRHPLPSQQFQALFDSLFKVLFIFPSRYLFGISLSPVFSLGWNLPPDWGCIPKQPDSPTAPRGATGSGHNGALTISGAPFQGSWAQSTTEDTSPDYNLNVEGDHSWWAFLGSLAVTKGILRARVGSVSPLRWESYRNDWSRAWAHPPLSWETHTRDEAHIFLPECIRDWLLGWCCVCMAQIFPRSHQARVSTRLIRVVFQLPKIIQMDHDAKMVEGEPTQ
ncbi:hypothetical protein VNO80_30701 [Phaseolus coccineus]|uniref:Senescence-associated protein n=1 Tax=Phaseolus coccineus TaxID=3886 RepID=A0AAN9QDQ1_PHACN